MVGSWKTVVKIVILSIDLQMQLNPNPHPNRLFCRNLTTDFKFMKTQRIWDNQNNF